MWSRTEGGYTIHSLEELRTLIEKHDAWGLTVHEFQEKAGYRREGNAEYITRFSWGRRNTDLDEVWELVQYIHKHYQSK